MAPSATIFLLLLFLGVGFVFATALMVQRLRPERQRRQTQRWLLRWGLKGMAVPLGLWALMNLGLSWWLQPYMPQVQAAQNAGGDWFGPFLRVAGAGIFVVTSYWMALTLGWTVVRVGNELEGEAQASFRGLSWTCCVGMAVPALVVLTLGGWAALGLAAGAVLLPLAGYAPVTLNAKKLPPMYARAIARIKFGKYAEAEQEIIRELEKCEDDFDGWLMLAELYANQFNDLSEAEQTILEICNHPRTGPSQLAIALHKLAEWHVKLRGDPAAARRALQIICDRLPGSHLARMARLRINQLPATADALRQQQQSKPIPLPVLHDPLDLTPALAVAHPDVEKATEAANNCIQRLERNPNNVSARELLARTLAEQLGQAERGIEQLMLLLGMPDQPEPKRAEWLALAAAWHLRFRQDTDTGRGLLERLLREYPQSPQALPARRRLQAVEMIPLSPVLEKLPPKTALQKLPLYTASGICYLRCTYDT